MSLPPGSNPPARSARDQDVLLAEALIRERVLAPERAQAALQARALRSAQGLPARLVNVLLDEAILSAAALAEFVPCARCGVYTRIGDRTPTPRPVCVACSAPLALQGMEHTQVDAGFALSRPAPEADGTNPAADPRKSAGRPFGRYRLLTELGRGGMGVVWKAWDTHLRREVALKQIAMTRAADNPDLAQRFSREARLAARLQHPGVVGILDVGEQDGQPYFTSEFVSGFSLDVRPKGPTPPRQAAEWVEGIAQALHYAHGQGVVHRDIKPANVMIDSQGRPRVMDFGLAAPMNEDETGREARLTVSGMVIGTPSYMSPEQARGEVDQLGPASDQFSLGATLYELLTGKVPFEGANFHAIFHAILERDPEPPRRRIPDLPRDLETICLTALAKNPAQRYPDLAAMAADLARWRAGEPIRARAEGWPARMVRQALRHRWLLASNLLVAALAGALWFAGSRPDGGGVPPTDRTARDRRTALAGAVLERWMAASPALARLEAAHVDSGGAPDEIRAAHAAAWAEVEAALSPLADDPAARAAVLALRSWALRGSGREPEADAALAAARAADPAVPFADAVEAWVELSRLLQAQPPPRLRLSLSRAVLDPRPPSPAAAESARRVLEGTARADAAEAWGEGPAQEFRRLLDAARAFSEARWETAERILGIALETPATRAFARDLRWARARVRYHLLRFRDALEDLDTLLRDRPRDAALRLERATARYALACEHGIRNVSTGPGFGGAREDVEEALRLRPRNPEALILRGYIRWAGAQIEIDPEPDVVGEARQALADAEAAAGLDPREIAPRLLRAFAWSLLAEHAEGEDERAALTAALNGFDGVLGDEPEDLAARLGRAYARILMARAHALAGADPFPTMAGALADAEALARREPDSADAGYLQGLVLRQIGDFRAAAGEDPGEAWRKAEQSLADAVTRDSRFARSQAEHGWALLRLQRFADAETALRKAVDLSPGETDLAESLHCARNWRAAAEEQPPAPWLARAAFAWTLAGLHLYTRAHPLLDEVVHAAAETPPPGPAGMRMLAEVHLYLAAIHSLRSVGRENPGAPATAVPPGEAARRRDLAFAHLEKALESIPDAAPGVVADDDFHPLHEDPRWDELFGS